jgi:hypothetical protein
MSIRRKALIAAMALVAVAALWFATIVPGQNSTAAVQRTNDGKPNLNGIWQAVTTANWNIEAHQAEPGPRPEIMGAWGAQPAGLGIVEGGAIPYKPEALERKQQNLKNRMVTKVTNDPSRFDSGDPELQCYRPGVPRANYMPFPFQIFQNREQIMIVYEYKWSMRSIYMDSKSEAPVDSWMGWSNGRWEGDTLVVDVKGFNGNTWFDRAGNFHSDALHVIERWTPSGPNHLLYEATIDDPKVFTRPWKIQMPLYRRSEPGKQILEYKCTEFVEQLMYGDRGLVDPATGHVNR